MSLNYRETMEALYLELDDAIRQQRLDYAGVDHPLVVAQDECAYWCKEDLAGRANTLHFWKIVYRVQEALEHAG